MGEIKDTVPLDLLPSRVRTMLRAFAHIASITWYREYNRRGTTLHTFLVKPERAIADAGYEEEMLLVYCPFPTLEPRALRVTEELFAEEDLFGRIEPYAFFLVSEAADVHTKFSEIGGNFFATRAALVFQTDELTTNVADPWYIRQRFLDRIASRDLFDIRLPLKDDFGFFGRADALTTILDSIRRSENVGVFGLRKVGKTSLLFRAKDVCVSQSIAEVAFIDCKSPDIWMKSWDQLLSHILFQIGALKAAQTITKQSAASVFLNCIVASKRRIALVFDEIEFISPESTTATHWAGSFVPFWQTIWAAQSATKKLSVLIAGVDSHLLEQSLIKKTQNPLFSIVKPLLLRGLLEPDLRSMVRKLGRKSGLVIEYEPAMWLFDRYGGHPLITRIACSVLNNLIKDQRQPRPFTVTVDFLSENAEYLDSSVLFYAEHVISSLKTAFAAEYQLLVALALGRNADFYDQAKNPATIRHLRAYGIVEPKREGGYKISIDIIRQYLASDHALNSKAGLQRWIVPKPQRTNWVKERVYRILKDFRIYDRLQQGRGIHLFGPNTLPEAELFADCGVVVEPGQWQNFVNAANRTFVESVEQYGRSIAKKDYFRGELKHQSPSIWHALNRIKLYRNDEMHLVLNGASATGLKNILLEDFGTCNLSAIGPDIYFVLQQVVLDGLLHGIQIDTARLEN